MRDENVNLICHIQNILRALMSVIKAEYEKAMNKSD
jgi:hypothetical protein